MNESERSDIPVALTLAGSDSGGGAGIQADLKTFAMHAVHGASVLTCVTAQNTTGVSRVDPLSVDSIIAQWQAVTSDLDVKSIKTGMLLSREIVDAVCDFLPESRANFIVVDPVMVSRNGDRLLDDDAINTIRERLLSQATILTPNRSEAQLLAEMEIETINDMKTAAEKIVNSGVQSVLVKGGGLTGSGRGIDVWFDGNEIIELETECIETTSTNGTGCSLSAAIAANLAKGMAPLEACHQAKIYVTEGLRHSLAIGKGKGPICHFHRLLEP